MPHTSSAMHHRNAQARQQNLGPSLQPSFPPGVLLSLSGAQLGKGAFGVVRLATKKDGGQDFAVKSISKAKLVNKDDVKDVLDEVRPWQ